MATDAADAPEAVSAPEAVNAAATEATEPALGDGLPTPPAEMVIADPEQLKALGDALRLQLLEVMGRRVRHGWTVKELAEATGQGQSQTKLYHHVNLLEERGLIRVVATSLVSGIVERRYQMAAQGYRLDRSLVSGADAGVAIGQLLDAAVDETRRQILQAIAAGAIDPGDQTPGRRLLIFRNRLRLRPDRIEAFTARLQELMDTEDAGDAPDAVEHGLLIAFYPVAHEDEANR